MQGLGFSNAALHVVAIKEVKSLSQSHKYDEENLQM
jgi:hypothetical protein